LGTVALGGVLGTVAFEGVLVTFLVGSFEGFVGFSVEFVSRMAEFAGDVALVSALACLLFTLSFLSSSSIRRKDFRKDCSSIW